MTPTLVKNFILLCISALIALVLGFAISVQNYELLVLPVILILLAATIVLPGYGFLLAFGLTCPFILPLPFVWGMPMLLLILGLCGLKYILRRALGTERLTLNYALPVALFFGWVVVRYCMHPVTPGIALGLSEGVTGFRAYMEYGLCAVVFLALGLFRTERDIVRLLRWMAVMAAGLVCIFLPLVFTKSLAVANLLQTLGIFVISFDNGWLRFVILPDFGLMLVFAAMLPNLFNVRKFWRFVALIVGLVAVVMGGNRSSMLMLFAVVVIYSFVRYRMAGLMTSVAAVVLCVSVMYYVGETAPDIHPALYRLTAVVSPRAAQLTEAEQTVEWRKLRWERAMEDIREHPWIGLSYGGLENAFVFATMQDYERASVDIDVAAGAVHNGYLANARAFGIPCGLLFVYILLSTVIRSARNAVMYRDADPIKSELSAFVWMYLAAMTLSIYIGTDINNARLWFLLGLGCWAPCVALRSRHDRPEANELPVAAVPV